MNFFIMISGLENQFQTLESEFLYINQQVVKVLFVYYFFFQETVLLVRKPVKFRELLNPESKILPTYIKFKYKAQILQVCILGN